MTFKKWLYEELGPGKDYDYGEKGVCALDDLHNYGAAAGFSGLMYYFETRALYDKYSEELWNVLSALAYSAGIKILEMLVQCYGGNVETDYQFKNLVVWTAAEFYAADYVNSKDTDLA